MCTSMATKTRSSHVEIFGNTSLEVTEQRKKKMGIRSVQGQSGKEGTHATEITQPMKSAPNDNLRSGSGSDIVKLR